MLFKLQKLVSWGCEAGWKATVAQQHAKHAEQQLKEARAAWDKEREQLRQQYQQQQQTASAVNQGLTPAAHPGDAGASGAGAGGGSGELQRAREAASEAETARAQAEERVSELEDLVASLQSDLRRMKAQLRASGSGSDAGSRDGSREGSGTGEEADPVAAVRAESMGWQVERTMLLRTITALQEEVEGLRAAKEAEVEVGQRLRSDEGQNGSAEVVHEVVRQLRQEHEAVVAMADDERQQLQHALALAAAESEELRQQLQLQAAHGPAGSAASEAGHGGEGRAEELAREVTALSSRLAATMLEQESQRRQLEEVEGQLELSRVRRGSWFSVWRGSCVGKGATWLRC